MPLEPFGVKVEPVETVDGIQVDGDGEQKPLDAGQDPVLVEAPTGEAGKVGEDLFVIGVKNMGAVAVHENPLPAVTVAGIPPDVIPLLHQAHALFKNRAYSFSQRRPGKAAAHDQVVVHPRAVTPSGFSLFYTETGRGKEPI